MDLRKLLFAVLVFVILVWRFGTSLLLMVGAGIVATGIWLFLEIYVTWYTCPNCGKRTRALDTVEPCVVCGKGTCTKCSQIMLFRAIFSYNELTTQKWIVVCSEKCWDAFSKSIKVWMDSNVQWKEPPYDALSRALKSYVQEKPTNKITSLVKRGWVLSNVQPIGSNE